MTSNAWTRIQAQVSNPSTQSINQIVIRGYSVYPNIGVGGIAFGLYGFQQEDGLTVTSYKDNQTGNILYTNTGYTGIGISYENTLVFADKQNNFTTSQTFTDIYANSSINFNYGGMYSYNFGEITLNDNGSGGNITLQSPYITIGDPDNIYTNQYLVVDTYGLAAYADTTFWKTVLFENGFTAHNVGENDDYYIALNKLNENTWQLKTTDINGIGQNSTLNIDSAHIVLGDISDVWGKGLPTLIDIVSETQDIVLYTGGLISLNSGLVSISGLIDGTTASFNNSLSAKTISASNIVNSINGITGNIALVAGSGINLSQSGNTFTIASSGGGGGVNQAFVIAMATVL